MEATPSPTPSLPTPSASPSTPVLSPNRSVGAHCHPRGMPAPAGRSAVVQPPGTQPVPPPFLPGTPSLHVPSSPPPPRAPPPPSCSAAPGQGAAGAGSDAARSSRRAGGAGAGASPSAPPSQARSPPRGAHQPHPHQAKEKKEKAPPTKLCNCPSNRQKPLLPTQMWGSFQDPSSGEFLGGTGRKPPTFHADRRLQTIYAFVPDDSQPWLHIRTNVPGPQP
ncbi:extensin-like [Herpailurus yagouaroundi]|uniref:extensin-like n=1 Tax=Herpailurus yagouaroundi TaxID=1608482 RepID=UPI001AD6880E|nr:extensin-like [Puma yagouaroundi]